MATSTIYFGGGCFWCTEAVFVRVQGVSAVQSGYANGQVPNPSYEQVCEGTTGHAEVIQVTYDPREVGLDTLLDIFFATHDPTTLNRQGNDVGTQYRSAIYATTAEQFTQVQTYIAQLAQAPQRDAPVVTEIDMLDQFWPAEHYHDDYFARNPHQGYCAYVVAPKVHKFLATFSSHAKRD